MKNIFIFANSYVVYDLLIGLEYIIEDKIEKVILLKEVLGSQSLCDRYCVETYCNLEACLQRCDRIIIVDDGNLPKHSLKQILEYSKNCQIDCFTVRFGLEYDACYELAKKQYKESIPMILCVSLGGFTQQLYIELLLNKIFLDICVPIDQIYSNSTKIILNDFYRQGILNSSIASHFDVKNGSALLNICSIKLNSNSTIQEIATAINQFNPDYFVFLVDEGIGWEDCTTLQNLVKYNCYKNINMFIKTHYHCDSEGGNYVLYCKDIRLDNHLPMVDVENSNLYDILKKSILTTLAIPEGIVQM